MDARKIKVLIVDDSRIVSGIVSELIGKDPELKVMGIAGDPYEAVKLIQMETPDVILLDIEMPKMDGITFLKKIMSQHPIPVVVFSGVAETNSKNAMLAFRYGALDVIPKPKSFTPKVLEEVQSRIVFALKASANSKNRLHLLQTYKPAHKTMVSKVKQPDIMGLDKIILIGASTGGTQAIEYILTRIEHSLPPVLITQHMPGGFTTSFAQRLDSICSLTVVEAEDNQILEMNHVYVANGYYHLQVIKSGYHFKTRLVDDPPVNRHKPAVDALFRSALKYVPSKKIIALLLTGMGDDGVEAMLELKESGAFTIAQDEKSSVVWGMPGKAVKYGAASKVMSLSEIVLFLNTLK